MKKTLLLVLSELPYPATKNGFTLRYYPLIKELAKYLDIDLVCFSDGDTPGEEGDLSDYTARLTVIKRSRAAGSIFDKFKSLSHMISPFGIPYALHRHETKHLANEINAACSGKYDVVLWAALSLTEKFTLCRRNISAERWVIDMVDSPSLHRFRAFGDDGLVDKLRLAKTRRWEAGIADICDLLVYISPRDRQEIESRVTTPEKLTVLPNGVFLDSYSAGVLDLQRPAIGFLGNMSYQPNVDAVHTLCRIHARARRQMPDLHLYIIGRDPLPEISVYDEQESITVTGTLDNIWPHVNGVDLFVLPMSMGAGQQNKILEIMYANKPVISSSVSNGGISAVDGESVIIGDDEDSCVEHIVNLFRDPERMKAIGDGGAEFVRQRYGWEKVASDFYPGLVGDVNT